MPEPMDMDRLWGVVIRLHNTLCQNPQSTAERRLLKVTEESGEVARAYINYVGANIRRKMDEGKEFSSQEIAEELVDVVITGLVSLVDWEGDKFVELLMRRVALMEQREETALLDWISQTYREVE